MRIRPVLASFVLIASAASPATADSIARVQTITVTGRATVTVPADELAFSVRLGNASPGTTSTAPGPQDLGQLEGAPRSLAAALTAAGASRVTIALDGLLNGANAYPFTVRGELDRPTHDRILGLVLSGALATLPDGGHIPVTSASGTLVVRNCAALLARADAAAFDDAKAQATALATHAHLRLGAVRDVASQSHGAPCASPDFSSGGGGPGDLPLDGPYTVNAFSSVAVTFTAG